MNAANSPVTPHSSKTPSANLAHSGNLAKKHARAKKTELRGRWALITGATAGIGVAVAELLAEAGVNLVITGRREERLHAIASELVETYGIKVKPLVADVRDRAALGDSLRLGTAELKQVSILINNAGLAAGVDLMQNGNLDDWEAMVDTNIKGLLFSTRFCLPFMFNQPASHIINIGSVAGRWVYPGGAVYCATKFAVRALTEGLRMDLMGKPVRVTNIEPGIVETEFSEVRLKDAEQARKVYEALTPLAAIDIAESVLWCLERPAHVNIQELIVFPLEQAAVGKVAKQN